MTLLCDGQLITTAPGAVILFSRRTPQYFRSDEPIRHDWMHLTGDVCPLLEANGLQANTLYYPASTAFITEITREMEAEFFGRQDGYERLLELKFEELAVKLGRAVSGQAPSSPRPGEQEVLQQLRDRIFRSLAEDWSVPRMAQQLGMSQSRFFALYRSVYKTSPTADLILARINRAKNLLLYENKSVEETAAALGYRNVTHFIRQFHDRTGLSPAAYRKAGSK